jgi:hypothetical protein
VEEEVGGVDGSVAAEKGERDSCDVRGGGGMGEEIFGTTKSTKMHKKNCRDTEWY